MSNKMSNKKKVILLGSLAAGIAAPIIAISAATETKKTNSERLYEDYLKIVADLKKITKERNKLLNNIEVNGENFKDKLKFEKARLSSFMANREWLQNKVVEQKREIKQLRLELTQASNSRARADNKNAKLTELNKKLSWSIINLRKQIEMLNNKVIEKDREIEMLNNKVIEKDRKIEMLKQDHKSSLKDLWDRIRNLSSAKNITEKTKKEKFDNLSIIKNKIKTKSWEIKFHKTKINEVIIKILIDEQDKIWNSFSEDEKLEFAITNK